MSKRRVHKCETCGQDGFYAIERYGLRQWSCQSDLQRGDKVFWGRGRTQFTVWTYQTSGR